MTDPRLLAFWIALTVGWFGIALVAAMVFGAWIRAGDRQEQRLREIRRAK